MISTFPIQYLIVMSNSKKFKNQIIKKRFFSSQHLPSKIKHDNVLFLKLQMPLCNVKEAWGFSYKATKVWVREDDLQTDENLFHQV